MMSYKMRMHTWPLDRQRKSIEFSNIFRMPPRHMAIACLSWWRLQKSSLEFLTFSKTRSAACWRSCRMMTADITVIGKANILRVFEHCSISGGRHMLWVPTCMGHARKAALRDHYFCYPHPSVLDRNQCSATNFLKETKGSTAISIAKQRVPCTRVGVRQSISSRKPTVRRPFR